MFGMGKLFGRKPRLTQVQQARLHAWQSLPPVGLKTAWEESRFVVVDVETSGLNLTRDHLIAIGAVVIQHGKLVLGASFETVLQQTAVSSKENILIHGITASAQSNGQAPADALLDFLEFLGKSPLVAFHVTFDQTMLVRAIQHYLGFSFKHVWLDLAYVAPGLHPAQKFRSLDDWQQFFGLQNHARHNALADAALTAQLMLRLMNVAGQQGVVNYAGLQSVEKNQRWVSWQG